VTERLSALDPGKGPVVRAQRYVEGAATRLEGLLLFLRRRVQAGLNEAVRVSGRDGRARLGRIVAMDPEFFTVEVMESTTGITLPEVRVDFSGRRLGFDLGPGLLGRVFNGIGEVIDGGPPVAAMRTYDIDGLPFNPGARQTPRDRTLFHRHLEQPGPGPEAADLLCRRTAS
jgi:V/A-type H+-transporting ATPase subunit B